MRAAANQGLAYVHRFVTGGAHVFVQHLTVECHLSCSRRRRRESMVTGRRIILPGWKDPHETHGYDSDGLEE
jgi:hypothetical protein